MPRPAEEREDEGGKKKRNQSRLLKRLLESALQARTLNIKSRQRRYLFPERQIPLITVH